MARQKSVTRLQGTIGELTFYRSRQDGFLAREKTSIDAARIRTDPRFARTRENGAEFGHAGAAGKLVRMAFMPVVAGARDGRVTSRLLKLMMAALKADPESARGARTVSKGDLRVLEGFEFNIRARLSATLPVPVTRTVDRAAGKAQVTIDPFAAADTLVAPSGATHYRVLMAVAEINFSTGAWAMDSHQTTELPLDHAVNDGVALEVAFAVGTDQPLMTLLGIEFVQEVNGLYYPLQDGVSSALAIVQVDQVKP